MRLRLTATFGVLLLSMGCAWAQDLNNTNNVELTNQDGAVGWMLMASYNAGTTTIVIQAGTNAPTVGSRFTLSQNSNHTDLYRIVTATGAGPVTLTITPGLAQAYGANTTLYWAPDVSTYKAITGCAPADATEVCVGWRSAHASDSRVVMSRNIYNSLGINPERWACAVVDPCPLTGAAGDSVTTHAVKVKKVFPLVDAYNSAFDQVWGFWVASIRTDTGGYATLGHLVDIVGGGGMLMPLTPVEANPAGSYDLRLYTFGPPSVYLGHAFPIQLATAKVAGVATSQIYLKQAILNDGSDHTCALTTHGGSCVDGVSFWVVTSLLSYQSGSPSTDYLYTATSCGPTAPCDYAADYQVGLDSFDNGTGTPSYTTQNFVWVKTTSGTTTPGAYTFKLTMQGITGGVDVGAGAAANYAFTVLASPTFSEMKATSFPAINNQVNSQGFMGYFSWDYCAATNVGQLWRYSQGVLDNGAYPASNVGLYYYDGSREELGQGDLVGAVAMDWQANHAYPYGTLIKPVTGNSGSYVYYTFPTGGGAIGGINGASTSAGTAPSWALATAWGSTVSDANGTSYFNVGTSQMHYKCAQANLDPFRNFLQVSPNYLQQWSATTNFSMLMDYYRTNDLKCKGSTQAGCGGGSAVVANDANALAQFYTSTGAALPNAYKYAVVADGFDVRFVSDMLQYSDAGDLINGTTDVMEKTRVDSQLAILEEAINLRSYADVDYQSNSFVLGTAAKTLYNGLLVESLINYYNKELLFNRYHPEIPTAVKAYLDWSWAHEWCTTPGAVCGSTGYNAGDPAAFLYTGASFPPFMPFDYTTTELNLLNATPFAWLYALTSNATYRTRGDLVFGNAFNSPSSVYAPKALGQQRNYYDYLQVRNGARVTTVNGHVYAPYGVFQDSNPCNSGEAWPCTIASTVGDATYPFNFNVSGGARVGTPVISNCNSVGCTFTWLTPESAPHNWVAYGTDPNNCAQLSLDSTLNTKVNDWTWQHVVVINNAGAGVTYYAAPRSESDAGIVSQERCNSNFGALYTFATSNVVKTINSGRFNSAIVH